MHLSNEAYELGFSGTDSFQRLIADVKGTGEIYSMVVLARHERDFIMLSEDESSSELSLSPLPSQEEDGFTLRRIAYVSYSWAYSYLYYIIVGTVPEVVIAIAVPDFPPGGG